VRRDELALRAREFGEFAFGPRFEGVEFAEVARGVRGESGAVVGAGGDEGVANYFRRASQVGDAVPPVRVFAVMRVVAVLDGELQ